MTHLKNWSETEEEELQHLLARGLSWNTIALLLQRKPEPVRRHALSMGIHRPSEPQVRAMVTRQADRAEPPPGVPPDRDTLFVQALVREAVKLGLVRVAA